MINQHNDLNYMPVMDGIEIKTTVHGKDTLMSKFSMKKGHRLPAHSYPDYEQTGYLLEGKIILSIGGTAVEMNPGDSWCIDRGVEHSAVIVEDSMALEVFSYPREDYLKFLDPLSR